jgi:signal transduction histidine kinase
MKRMEQPHGYQGGYLIGFIIIGVVAIRAILFYQGQTNLILPVSLLGMYSLSYILEPWLSSHFSRQKFWYFPLQTGLVIVLTNLRPFMDVPSLLYVPLCIQVLRAFSRPTAIIWLILYVALLAITLMIGLGWQAGLALVLLFLAVCTFLISFDLLYSRTRADQGESQRLLADLQAAHQKLKEYAAQAEELAATRERNRLARELHDSVSQVIFSITLTSQSTHLLLERDPSRVREQIERLQEMTSSALSQLRSLIAELRPQPK